MNDLEEENKRLQKIIDERDTEIKKILQEKEAQKKNLDGEVSYAAWITFHTYNYLYILFLMPQHRACRTQIYLGRP